MKVISVKETAIHIRINRKKGDEKEDFSFSWLIGKSDFTKRVRERVVAATAVTPSPTEKESECRESILYR